MYWPDTLLILTLSQMDYGNIVLVFLLDLIYADYYLRLSDPITEALASLYGARSGALPV